jgi:hypothetical protein
MEDVRAAMKTKHLEADQWLNRNKWCFVSGRRRPTAVTRPERQIDETRVCSE